MSFASLWRMCAVCIVLSVCMVACGGGEETADSLSTNGTASPAPPTLTPSPSATPFVQLTAIANTTSEEGETAGPTVTAPAEIAINPAIATVTPSPITLAQPPDILYNDIGLSYQSRLDYARVLPEAVAETPRQPGIGIDRGNPAYTRFTFGSANPSDEFFRPTEPQIRIYDIASYRALFPEIDGEIAKLDQLLATRPTTSEANDLPLLPLTGLSETFFSQLDYVSFQNQFGHGVRYIAQYDQIAGPIHNSGMFYTYQGVTADRKNYVVAFFPVQLDFLPATFETADLTPFQTEDGKAAYYEQTVAEINNLTVGDFLPSLNVFDDVIRSLTIGAEIVVETDGVEAAIEAPSDTDDTAVASEPLTAVDSEISAIQGKIIHPDGVVPLMRIYALSTDGTKFFFTELLESPTYRLPVDPGTYEVYAYTVEQLESGGYTTYATCTETFRGDCGDQQLIPVAVNSNEEISNVNITDWEITNYRFPLPPDDLAPRVEQLRAEAAGQASKEYATITGVIDYPEGETPPIRMYAQNITTGELFTQQLDNGSDQYAISVSPGTYILYGYTTSTTEAVSGGGYANGNSGLIPFTVDPATSVPNITLGNWNQPPLDYLPAVPNLNN